MNAQFVTAGGTFGFDGPEWDIEVEVDRNMEFPDDVVGSYVRGMELFLNEGNPQIHDMIALKFTAWMPSSQAAPIEANAPPYAAGWKFDLYLGGLAADAIVPGFGNHDGTYWKFLNCVMLENVESMGCKGVRQNLFGYRFTIAFAANGYGNALNERGASVPVSTTVPAILSKKFMAHQIQDASRSAVPLPMDSTAIGAPATIYTGVQHGRRLDAAMALDHLSAAEADQVVRWFRAIRGNVFSVTNLRPFGPSSSNTVNAVARGLKIQRGAGWWFDLVLDLTKV